MTFARSGVVPKYPFLAGYKCRLFFIGLGSWVRFLPSLSYFQAHQFTFCKLKYCHFIPAGSITDYNIANFFHRFLTACKSKSTFTAHSYMSAYMQIKKHHGPSCPSVHLLYVYSLQPSNRSGPNLVGWFSPF